MVGRRKRGIVGRDLFIKGKLTWHLLLEGLGHQGIHRIFARFFR